MVIFKRFLQSSN